MVILPRYSLRGKMWKKQSVGEIIFQRWIVVPINGLRGGGGGGTFIISTLAIDSSFSGCSSSLLVKLVALLLVLVNPWSLGVVDHKMCIMLTSFGLFHI